MPKQTNNTQQKMVYVLIPVCFVAGYFLGSSMNSSIETGTPNQTVQKKEIGKNSFADGWEAAKQELITVRDEFGMMITSEIQALNGSIVKVDGKKLTFTTRLLNPLDDKALKERTVLVTEETEIILRKLKDQTERNKKNQEREAVIQKLMQQDMETEDEAGKTKLRAEINKLMMEDGEVNVAYEPYEESTVKIKDLKPGYQIVVEAGENIAQKQEFTAKKIVAEEIQ